MLPWDIIGKMICEQYYRVTVRYSDYTKKENVIVIENGSAKATFCCTYENVSEMEQDMNQGWQARE